MEQKDHKLSQELTSTILAYNARSYGTRDNDMTYIGTHAAKYELDKRCNTAGSSTSCERISDVRMQANPSARSSKAEATCYPGSNHWSVQLPPHCSFLIQRATPMPTPTPCPSPLPRTRPRTRSKHESTWYPWEQSLICPPTSAPLPLHPTRTTDADPNALPAPPSRTPNYDVVESYTVVGKKLSPLNEKHVHPRVNIFATEVKN